MCGRECLQSRPVTPGQHLALAPPPDTTLPGHSLEGSVIMEANSAQKGEERQAQTEETTCPTNVTQMSGADLTVKSPKTVWKENRAVSTCENSLHTYWSLPCAKCLLYIQLCKKNIHQTSPFTVTSSLRAETGLDSIPKLP